jgi:alkanesulfonate monooxygenase SsuD/methylene tetrahydromethanopterin reductase-like flavin-dependent oxidoreductase (luciferase family)
MGSDGLSEQTKRSCKIGLILPQANKSLGGATPTWQDILAFAQHAEAVGFDSLWLADDYYGLSEHGEAIGYWECWSLLSALATHTSRVLLGPLVSCNGYRHPALLAKIADTVDEISGGRLILGVGVGYNQPLNEDFGLPWEKRYSCFEEALIILQRLLQTGYVHFQGQHYQVRNCQLLPRGPRSAGPPIMIAGMARPGSRLLRLVAHYAQILTVCTMYEADPLGSLSPLGASIDDACQKWQRAPETLERIATMGVVFGDHRLIVGQYDITSGALSGTPEEIATAVHMIVDSGFSHILIQIAPCTRAGIDAFLPVLEYL